MWTRLGAALRDAADQDKLRDAGGGGGRFGRDRGGAARRGGLHPRCPSPRRCRLSPGHMRICRLSPSPCLHLPAACTSRLPARVPRLPLLSQVVTIGLGTVCFNERCVAYLMAAGDAKARVVQRACEAPASDAVPGSALRCLPSARLCTHTHAHTHAHSRARARTQHARARTHARTRTLAHTH